MSISSELQRINAAKNTIQEKMIAAGLAEEGDNLTTLAENLEIEGGSVVIDNVTIKRQSGALSAIGVGIVATVNPNGIEYSSNWLLYNGSVLTPDANQMYRVEINGTASLWYWNGLEYIQLAGAGSESQLIEVTFEEYSGLPDEEKYADNIWYWIADEDGSLVEDKAAESAAKAKQSEINAAASAIESADSATEASGYAGEAETYATAADTSASTAANQALLAESHSHGKTGVRQGEDTDNAEYYKDLAKYYKDQAKEIAGGVEGHTIADDTSVYTKRMTLRFLNAEITDNPNMDSTDVEVVITDNQWSDVLETFGIEV